MPCIKLPLLLHSLFDALPPNIEITIKHGQFYTNYLIHTSFSYLPSIQSTYLVDQILPSGPDLQVDQVDLVDQHHPLDQIFHNQALPSCQMVQMGHVLRADHQDQLDQADPVNNPSFLNKTIKLT